MGEGPHGPGNLPDGDDFPGLFQTQPIAPGLVVPDGQFEAEGDRLGMDPVGTSDHHRFFVAEGLLPDRLLQGLQIVQQDIGGFLQQDGHGGIQHIGGGQTQVDVTAGRSHMLGHIGQEGDHVVLGDPFQLIDPFYGKTGFFLDDRQVPGRYESLLGQGLAGRNFHVQPFLIFILRTPELGHYRPGVAGDHIQPPI